MSFEIILLIFLIYAVCLFAYVVLVFEARKDFDLKLWFLENNIKSRIIYVSLVPVAPLGLILLLGTRIYNFIKYDK